MVHVTVMGMSLELVKHICKFLNHLLVFLGTPLYPLFLCFFLSSILPSSSRRPSAPPFPPFFLLLNFKLGNIECGSAFKNRIQLFVSCIQHRVHIQTSVLHNVHHPSSPFSHPPPLQQLSASCLH